MEWNHEAIKFYSAQDWGAGHHLRKVEDLLKTFEPQTLLGSIDECLELYNVKKFIDAGLRFPEWSDVMVDSFKDKCIYVDVESMKRAGQIDNPEFAELTKIREALPGYKLETKEFPKKNKQTYDGLKIPVMQAFIIQYEATPEKAASALRELNKKKAEGLLRGATYGVVKSWFIKKYGDVYNGSALSKKDGKRDALIKELLGKVDPTLIDPIVEIEKEVA